MSGRKADREVTSIKTADGRTLSLIGHPKKHRLYLAVPGALDGADVDHVMANGRLLRFLETATKRVRANIEHLRIERQQKRGRHG